LKIFLIDGSALVYRAHFAMARRPLLSRHGEITNASYGTANAVLRLWEEEGADAVICCFDLPGKTIRHERYPEYKATRKPMPDELVRQLPRVRETFAAMGVPVLDLERYEADDLIGTLAREGEELGHEIWIYSADKDFMQLVRPAVRMLKPAAKSGAADEVLDEAAIKKKTGVRPDQFRDVLALMGDASDHVPGVPGIGKKTAEKLIATFGDLDALLDRLQDKRVSPRQRKLIEDNREMLLLSRELVTIDERVPLDFGWSEIRPLEPFTESFRALCKELDFSSLLHRFVAPPVDQAAGTESSPRDYLTIDSIDSLRQFLEELDTGGTWAIDTETTSLDPHQAELVGISISGREARAAYVPVRAGVDPVSVDLFAGDGEQPRLEWGPVRDCLAAPFGADEPRLVGQNLKYDQIVLRRHGLELGGVSFDTMVASYLLAPERRQHGLDSLSEDELGIVPVSFKEMIKAAPDRDIRRVPIEELAWYAAEDADLTRRLFTIFQPRLEEEGLAAVMAEIEIPLSQVLMRMEYDGICLDTKLLGELARDWRVQLERLVTEIHEIAGEPFNINSPKQLQVVLFEKLELKPTKKTTTGWSTDVSVLTGLAEEHELPRKLLDYRHLAKLLSTYVEALPRLVHPETGCVHTSFNQAVAATGRLSSTDPNLQNIPVRTGMGRRIREAFVPRDTGWSILAADYSQIELRLMAHFAHEESLIDSFRNGEDIHRRTAAIVNGVDLEGVDEEMRRAAKAINFGILYGMGARALGQQIGVKAKAAQAFIDDYFERLPKVREWIDTTIEQARDDEEVRTLYGRRRKLPELQSKDPRQKAFGERIAVNTRIQGTAADLIKIAMIRLDRRIREDELPVKMLLQVHDELVFEVEDSRRDEIRDIVCTEMEDVAELLVPLAVEAGFGASWAEAH
jgi:DNA polymerase-1